jgi:phage baseplate assembly protein W
MADNRNWQVSLSDPSKVVEGAEDIAQCIYAILATVKGSDPLRVSFGSDLHRYLDKPLNDVRPLMVYAVREALSLWERRIVVNKCSVTSGSAAGSVNIRVEVEVLASDDQLVVDVTV